MHFWFFSTKTEIRNPFLPIFLRASFRVKEKEGAVKAKWGKKGKNWILKRKEENSPWKTALCESSLWEKLSSEHARHFKRQMQLISLRRTLGRDPGVGWMRWWYQKYRVSQIFTRSKAESVMWERGFHFSLVRIEEKGFLTLLFFSNLAEGKTFHFFNFGESQV